MAPAGVLAGGPEPRIGIRIRRAGFDLVGEELEGRVGARRHGLSLVDAGRRPRGEDLGDTPDVVLQTDGQHNVETHLHRVVAYLQLAVSVLALGPDQDARLEAVVAVPQPDPVGLGPGDRRPAIPGGSLQLLVLEEAALTASDPAQLPAFALLGLLRFRAGALTVPRQAQLERPSDRGELQYLDLAGQVDPDGVLQRGEQVVGQVEVRKRSGLRTRVVVGRDILARLGGIGQGLRVRAPLAHPHAVAPAAPLERERVGTRGDNGRRHEDSRKDHGEKNPPEHRGSL